MSQTIASAAGSGGFVYRAERHTGPDATSTTGANIGPGTYQSGQGGAESVPAAAPFHTSSDRHQDPAFTPGPGAYDVAAAAAALLGPAVVNPNTMTPGFASQTSRIHVDKTHDHVPGPGTYTAGPKWVKKTHRYSAPEARLRLSYQRNATAPSIPANHQSYGYEEDPLSGALIMQRPLEPPHTGVGLDRVGPGSYNPDTTPIAPRIGDKAPTWSNSRTERLSKYNTDVPGPGAYHAATSPKAGTGVTVTINGVDVMFGGAGGSSSFASKAPRAHQRVPQEHEVTPGPGAYLAIPTKMRSSHPHFFGSTGPRGFEIDPTRSLAAPSFYKSPGPGAYDDSRRSLSAPVAGSFAETNPFNVTSSRFGRQGNDIPGPGEYQLDSVTSIKHDIHAAAHVGRSGVFGTNSLRFNAGGNGLGSPAGGAAVVAALGWNGGSSAPGPGAYDPPLRLHKPGSRYESSTFASHTDRFAAPPGASKPDLAPRSVEDKSPTRGDPAARGPGSYDLSLSWANKKGSHKHTGFGSETKRTGPSTAASNTPGPGRYQAADKDMNAALRPVVHPSPEVVFGGATSRFIQEKASYVPGPGQYELERSSVQKRSYNVTYTAA